jgi:hypothetical protein
MTDRLRSRLTLVFWGIFILWTIALEMPVPPAIPQQIGSWWAFLLAKSLHFTVFGTETILALCLYPQWGIKARFVGFVSLQAFGTELFQYLLSDYFHRTGAWKDVLIDHVGIAIGTLVYLAFSSARRYFYSINEKANQPSPV